MQWQGIVEQHLCFRRTTPFLYPGQDSVVNVFLSYAVIWETPVEYG